MKKRRIAVYEMVGVKKHARVLILKDDCIEICKWRGLWDTKEYEIDSKSARIEIKRSNYYGRKDFADLRCSKYPYLAKLSDKVAGCHIFWIDRDVDAEILENYIKRTKGISAFS